MNQLVSHHRHPQEKERGRSSSSTVVSEPTQSCNHSVGCAESLWGKSGEPRDVAVQFIAHCTEPGLSGLVSRLGIASNITHTTLSHLLALHLSQFLHL